MRDLLVVKIGGSAGVDMAEAVRDLAALARHRPLVVVHGVSERMARLSEERGLPVQMLESPGGHSWRYTPPPVRDLFVEAARSVNADLVAGLRRQGIAAQGLTERVPVYGERKQAVRARHDGRVRVVRDDHTGSISGVESAALFDALYAGEVAVVPPLAASMDGLLNIDGDRAAAAIAAALRAETLVILSNVRGLYRDFRDEGSFVANLPTQRLHDALDWAQGRMKRKVIAAGDALDGGVGRVVIADGRVERPVTQALAGAGTVFAR